MTNLDRLNEGPPAIDTSIAPQDLPTEDQVNWGRAFQALLGTKGTAENQLGTAILRLPVPITGLTVSGNTVTLSEPGAVISVEAIAGTRTGGFPIGSVATPGSQQCRVTYDGDYIPTVRFANEDAVTECAVVQLQVPAAFIAAMNAANPP